MHKRIRLYLRKLSDLSDFLDFKHIRKEFLKFPYIGLL